MGIDSSRLACCGSRMRILSNNLLIHDINATMILVVVRVVELERLSCPASWNKVIGRLKMLREK